MECTRSESVKCCQEQSMREEENYRFGVKIAKDFRRASGPREPSLSTSAMKFHVNDSLNSCLDSFQLLNFSIL